MVNRRLTLTLAPQFVVHLENDDNFIKERMECRTYLSNVQNKIGTVCYYVTGLKYIDLAKPKSGARIFFPARLKGTTPCPGQD